MSEMTPEKNDKINAFADGLAGMVKESRRFLVREAIEAAEERGRQSAEAQAEGLLGRPVLEVAADRFECQIIESNKPPSEWADLSHLSGRELVDRLKARAEFFSGVQCDLEDMECIGTDADDRVLLCDLIYAKEQAVTREVERLQEEPEQATE